MLLLCLLSSNDRRQALPIQVFPFCVINLAQSRTLNRINCGSVSGDAAFSMEVVTIVMVVACGAVVLNCFVFHLNFFHGFLFPWPHLLHLKWGSDRARLIGELFEYFDCGPSVEHTLLIRSCSSFSSLSQLIVKASLHHRLFQFPTGRLTGFTLSSRSQIVGNLVFLALLSWL